MSLGTCRGCGAMIKWIKTPAGKNMPCDSMQIPFWQHENGPDKIVTIEGKVVSCYLEGDPDDMTGYGYKSHFSTCPKADRFKRAGKVKGTRG